MGARKAFKECPYCGVSVKREKYNSHVKKLHEAQPQPRTGNGTETKAPKRAMKRSMKRAVFFSVVFAIVVVLATIAISVWVQREEGGVSSYSDQGTGEYVEHSIATSSGWAVWGRSYLASPGAPVVVLVHGLNTDHSVWEPLMPSLKASNYNVITVDLPGFGRSMYCNGSLRSGYDNKLTAQDFEEMPNAVSALVFRAMTDRGMSGQKIIAIGASIGANIALIYGSAHDVDGFVLLSPISQFVSEKPEDHIGVIGETPVLVLVSTKDSVAINTAHQIDDSYSDSLLMTYDGDYHGTDMLKSVPTAVQDISDWLAGQGA